MYEIIEMIMSLYILSDMELIENSFFIQEKMKKQFSNTFKVLYNNKKDHG